MGTKCPACGGWGYYHKTFDRYEDEWRRRCEGKGVIKEISEE